MTIFFVACAGLILFSTVFYLFPKARAGSTEADLDRANLESFRLREAELAAEGDDALEQDARLRLLEDESQRSAAQLISKQSFPVWMLFPLVAVAASALYYVLGAAPDVEITQQMQNIQEDITPQEMQSLIDDVAARSKQRPDNLHYLSLLGRYYMGQGDYEQAAQSYDALAEAVPEDAQALAYAAQARYLAAGRTLNNQSRLRAEQALAADPNQRTALGLLGMASFEQKQYRAAIEYWQRLLALEPPGSESRQMIEQVIATAHQHLGVAEPGADTPPVAEPVATTDTEVSAGVTVTVSLPPDAEVGATDTVFILARSADSQSRMPIAVQRLTGAELPMTIRLDDSNSMAGQKLSETPSIVVAVQVSPDGRPGEANASWLGQAGPLAPSEEVAPVEIVLTPKSS